MMLLQFRSFHRGGRRGNTPRGFTLIELLVVISIIALLISLLLPALAKAKNLAEQVVCASNLQQIGFAIQEYANEYKGQYPLNSGNKLPFGGFNSPAGGSAPAWGFGLLYYSSFGVSSTTAGVPSGNMINPQPGILKPTKQGVSLLFSTQPGFMANEQTQLAAPGNWTNGILTHWAFYAGYCYWVDRGTSIAPGATVPESYSPNGDLYEIYLNHIGSKVNWSSYWHYYNYTRTSAMPAQSNISAPGTVLATDLCVVDPTSFLLTSSTASTTTAPTAGLLYYGNLNHTGPANMPMSNHVTTSANALADGVHVLHNDASVNWDAMGHYQVHYSDGGFDFAW